MGENVPQVDSVIFKNKGKRKTLTLILDDGDDVLVSIKQGMKQHKLQEARVDDMQGTIKEGTISYMDGSQYKAKNLINQPIIMASGNFKLSFDELFGSMHVTTAGKNHLTATFVRGLAATDLQIKLSFIEFEE